MKFNLIFVQTRRIHYTIKLRDKMHSIMYDVAFTVDEDVVRTTTYKI